MDATYSIQAAAEIARACKIMRDSYLESRKDELMETFSSYLKASGEIKNQDQDAVLFGFRQAWKNGDYGVIIDVGKKLPPSFYEDNREAHAYFLASQKFSAI